MPAFKREIKPISASVEKVDETIPTEAAAFSEWLLKQALGNGLSWLLGHCDDGVVWGCIQSGELRLSSNHFPAVSPPLRPATLQEVRLFGEDRELLLWRSEGRIAGRWVRDRSAASCYTEAFDESYMLWGDTVSDQKAGFTLWKEGAQGLAHAVPHPAGSHPPRLVVRHYLAKDKAARVALSRLVCLKPDKEETQNDKEETQKTEEPK
jgi:CRISPR-associated protein (TIGR03984 family)